MRVLETYKGYDIVETDWTTEVRVGGREEVREVLVIMGLKERPSSPFITTVEEAREYVDAELAGREAMREARTATWDAVVRHKGNSLAVVIPSRIARSLEVDDGIEVRVTVERL